jgi:hypothetical protein
LVVLAVLVLVVGAFVVTRKSPKGAPVAVATTTTHASTTTTTAPPYVPPAIAPVVTPATAGEGQWTTQDPWSPGGPSVMTTNWRPYASNPSVVAFAAWMRTSSTQLALFPGYEGPGPTSFNRGPEEIPPSSRGTLLAAFNSGFYEEDAAAGFYTNGTLYDPMIDGLATVVAYTDGTVDIVDWSGGPTPGPNIVMARQNLGMLVDHSQPTAAVTNGPAWGITLGGGPAVPRTGLGIDAHGNLIYVTAADQTAQSLAQLMVQVGAVRAMQLDINPAWPIYVTYGGPGAANPSLDVVNYQQYGNRFLYSSTKEFFALYIRTPGVVQQPW